MRAMNLRRKTGKFSIYAAKIIAVLAITLLGKAIPAQVDQGAITGIVQGPIGIVIQNAKVKVIDTGITLQIAASGDVVYVVSPLKIGNYKVSANGSLDAISWNALTTPSHHENQFGTTLGFPTGKNHHFYFGDAEVNRIAPVIRC